ncbi:hypothetical protein [Aureitalea marina]|uniref:SH3b domain-containing protein n=1 Tax=Aureitalea marina TaxID=930804 RepID=A0A2S7KT41_9FLAO|nr:hypothetical protein [Aureitalea marina]PQB05791.1 hypothetical protein BST85_13470 [Aureitalea marina]
MKIVLSIILTVLTIQSSFGQVATIQDPDGWTNVRKSPDGTSEIIQRVYENEVFWYDSEETDQEQKWISIYIPKNDYSLGKSEPGYIVGFIHKSRLLPLEKLQGYTGNDFTFKYELGDFDSTNRIIDKQDGKWISAIDGRPVWGTDGNFPKTQVDNIKVIIDGQEIEIHEVFYSDIYECDNEISIYKNGETYFAHQWNSDGAGAYEIVWVLDKNGLKQRLVGTII